MATVGPSFVNFSAEKLYFKNLSENLSEKDFFRNSRLDEANKTYKQA
jgi:hypothetical protein